MTFVNLTVRGKGGGYRPPGPPFLNLTAPAITGAAVTGQTLTVTNGTWSLPPTSYTWQWKRGTDNIAGATAATYLLTIDDLGKTISCAVTAYRPNAIPLTISSNTVTPVAPPVGNTIVVTDLGNGLASALTTGTVTVTDLGNGLASVATATITDLGNGLAVAA